MSDDVKMKNYSVSYLLILNMYRSNHVNSQERYHRFDSAGKPNLAISTAINKFDLLSKQIRGPDWSNFHAKDRNF